MPKSKESHGSGSDLEILMNPRRGLHKPSLNASRLSFACDESVIAPTYTSLPSQPSRKLRLSLSQRKRSIEASQTPRSVAPSVTNIDPDWNALLQLDSEPDFLDVPELVPASSAKKLKMDPVPDDDSTSTLKPPMPKLKVIRKSDDINLNGQTYIKPLNNNNSHSNLNCLTAEELMENLFVAPFTPDCEHAVPTSSSSIVSFCFNNPNPPEFPLIDKRGMVVPEPVEPVAQLPSVVVSSQSKTEFVQQWVDNCDLSDLSDPVEPVSEVATVPTDPEVEFTSLSASLVESVNGAETIEYVEPVEAVNLSDQDTIEQPIAGPSWAEPHQSGNPVRASTPDAKKIKPPLSLLSPERKTIPDPSEKSSLSAVSAASKQTSITAFFTPRKSLSPVKAPAIQPRPVIMKDLVDDDSRSSHNVLEVTQIPARVPEQKQDSKTQWCSLMSRMRGTPSNLAREMKNEPASPRGGKSRPDAVKSCPFYKRIPNTGFVIDAFCYGPVPDVTCYFLSHFHYDHYRGLGRWLNKPMYCSQVTANLVQLKIKLDPNLVRILPMNESRLVEKVEVILLDANHCPGAVMFLFRFPTGRTILHVGDFRADPSMETWKELIQRPIDHLYLDTTYCDKNYNFPAQRKVLDYVRRLVRQYADRHPKLLVVAGTYTIGKEKVFMAAAEELDCRVWAPVTKRNILTRLEDPVIAGRLIQDPLKGRVHVVNISDIKANNLKKYLDGLKGAFSHVLAFHPTGWEFDERTARAGLDSIRPKTFGNIHIYGVPYSEHSGFDEMKRFVTFFKPKKIIPTVNIGSAKQRQDMEKVFNTWLKR